MEIIQATHRAINSRGVASLRLKDIASEAQLSIGLIHYYFPNMEELVFAVHQSQIATFIEKRKILLELPESPAQLLYRMISMGLPENSDDEVFRLFYELHSLAVRSQPHAELMATLWKEEVQNGYLEIFKRGVADGSFKMSCDPHDCAIRMVAFEDGLSVQLLSRNNYITLERALQVMLDYAGEATGCAIIK